MQISFMTSLISTLPPRLIFTPVRRVKTAAPFQFESTPSFSVPDTQNLELSLCANQTQLKCKRDQRNAVMKTSTTSTPTRAQTTPQNALRTTQPSQTRDGQTTTPAKQRRKRKATAPAAPLPGTEVVDLTEDTPPSSTKKPRSQGRRPQDESPERRARRWRAHPPQSYMTRLERIRTQRCGFFLGCIASCANVSCAGCLSLAIPWAGQTKSLRSHLISSGRLAISTEQ